MRRKYFGALWTASSMSYQEQQGFYDVDGQNCGLFSTCAVTP